MASTFGIVVLICTSPTEVVTVLDVVSLVLWGNVVETITKLGFEIVVVKLVP